MVKISITLPNNAQITFESEESELLREIIALALHDLPRDLMRTSSPDTGIVSKEKGKSNTASTLTNKSSPEPSSFHTPINAEPESLTTITATRPNSISKQTGTKNPIPPEYVSDSRRTAFKAFCKDVNPLGDMRRVVVATEGAIRHFGVDGVDANDLEWLFDAAGWRRPGNFTQTLRNAARSKFGWLERIPGRAGRYAATPLGVSETISII